MTYVIVYYGYEGIEHLLWAGANADEARQHVMDYRATCERMAAVRLSQRARRFGNTILTDMDDPDRVCVLRKEDGNEAFTCCCAVLNVRPSKLVLR